MTIEFFLRKPEHNQDQPSRLVTSWRLEERGGKKSETHVELDHVLGHLPLRNLEVVSSLEELVPGTTKTIEFDLDGSGGSQGRNEVSSTRPSRGERRRGD